MITTSAVLEATHRHGSISTSEKPHRAERKPHRGGQNLSHRYLKLEHSLRGKEEISRELNRLEQETPTSQTPPIPKVKDVELFHGLEIPKEPIPPTDEECCMSGCAVCVYDLHEEAVDAYRSAVSSIITKLTTMNIPNTEWPAELRKHNKPAAAQPVESRKEVVLSAFEEMERALALKKEQETVGGKS
ncbi:hypothetical protein CVT24_004414 [Panaeolus cyanescens]|uniref:Oxidoreductase-like domain-containing protein n=1 Tax=Panaeolus cyanescens TaxID=181874 RepID=A0A409VE02_9AGAR|nr:hypothetical protein CVT24_004414 [Panaeolus cyanescens]